MAPLHLGLVGLSADGQWASKSHLPYFQSKPDKFRIVALQNSSVASAKRSVEKYQLGNDVACYGNPDDLAQDANVDVVVVCVKVPMHYDLVKPALQAKKQVFVEWPLAANVKQAEELTQLAKTANVKNFVGLQARQSPSIIKAKQMVQQGELGEIVGTILFASGMVLGPASTPANEYIADIDNGANLVSIPAGHAMDALCYVLGDLRELSATLGIRRPTQDIVDNEGKVLRTINKTSHDYMSVTGTLRRGNGIATVVYQGGTSDTGKDFYWEINGTKGSLVLEGSSGHVQMSQPTVKFVKFGAGKNEMREVEIEQAKSPANNVGKAWDAILGDGDGSVVTFEDALVRHRMLDAIYRSNKSKKRESYL